MSELREIGSRVRIGDEWWRIEGVTYRGERQYFLTTEDGTVVLYPEDTLDRLVEDTIEAE